MSNIVITGALGLIGHNIVQRLETKHNLLCIDNLTNYGIIPQDQLDYLISERRKKINSKVHVVDICDHATIDTLMTEFYPDTVIHLASFPRQKVVNANPQAGAKVMVEGLINLLELAVKFQVKRFVYISSSMVYGDFNEQASESFPCKPQGQYGIMKYMGEKLVEDYSRKHGFEYVIIRPSAVYGELDVEDRVISKFMLAALRGQTLRVKGENELLDFTYVEDAADGICLAATKIEAANQVFNITKSASITLKKAAELAISLAGKGSLSIESKDQDFPSRASLDISKAKSLLGYDPKVTVEEGFAKYYKWLKNSQYFNPQ